MADFALWATACETALWPAGTFARAYTANRRAAIESIVDADPVAACVREIMAERSSWAGSAADLLRAGADRNGDSILRGRADWPKNPRALSGRLRRAQTLLRALGIEVAFGREGRAGSRVIRMHTTAASTVSSVRANGSPVWSGQSQPEPAGDGCDDNCCPDLRVKIKRRTPEPTPRLALFGPPLLIEGEDVG